MCFALRPVRERYVARTRAGETCEPTADAIDKVRWVRENRDEFYFWSRYEDLLRNPQEFPKPPSIPQPNVLVEGPRCPPGVGEVVRES